MPSRWFMLAYISPSSICSMTKEIISGNGICDGSHLRLIYNHGTILSHATSLVHAYDTNKVVGF